MSVNFNGNGWELFESLYSAHCKGNIYGVRMYDNIGKWTAFFDTENETCSVGSD